MKKITVFCGSSMGTNESFYQQAKLLGKTIVKQNIGLVYGGANIGLMSAVADGAISEKGTVIGVIPEFLKSKEIAHKNLTKLITVNDMHERKTVMHDLCNGIIALPGGFGTLEELFEMLTWSTLKLHKKPIGLLNINGFYDSLILFTETMVSKGFLKKENKNKLLISDNIDDLLKKMSI